jgi:glycogen operon protein
LYIDDNFYIIFNAHYEDLEFQIPIERYGTTWMKAIDTGEGFVSDENSLKIISDSGTIIVEGRSVVVLKQPKFLKK